MDPRSFLNDTNHCKPPVCGTKCQFESKTANKSKSPKRFAMPSIKLKGAVYYDDTQGIKLTFTIRNASEDLIVVDEYLKMHVLCADADADGEIFDNPIHEEYIPLNECHHLSINGRQRSQKSSLFINNYKQFRNSGVTEVDFKIRMVFQSPDEMKYENVHSEWSRALSLNVPNAIPKRICLIAVIDYGSDGITKKRLVMKNNPQRQLYQYTMAFLRERLMLKFKLKKEYFDIKTECGKLIQMDDDILRLQRYYVRDEVFIIPYTEALLFGFVRTIGCRNVSDDIIRMIFHWFSGHSKFRALGNSWNSWKEVQAIKVEEDQILVIHEPKRACLVVQFSGVKKRIVLKKWTEKNINEFTIDALIAKTISKYKTRGLTIPFTMTTDNGHIIQSDHDITNYLLEYEGEIKITQ